MDRHLEALALPGIAIIERQRHQALSTSRCYDFQVVEGFDHPRHDSSHSLIRARNKLFELTAIEVNPSPTEPRIMMIERLPADPFYLSTVCEIQTAGAGRRSIPNFRDLIQSLAISRPTIVALEQMALVEQIDLLPIMTSSLLNTVPHWRM